MRDGDVAVERAHQERAHAVRLGLLDVRIGCEELCGDVIEPIASCIEQRRHSAALRIAASTVRQSAAIDTDAFRAAARAFAGLHELRLRADARLRVDGRAALEQQRHRRGLPLTDGDHQRRLAEFPVPRVELGACGEQRFERGRHARACGDHQRRFAVGPGGGRIGAGGNEQLDHRRIAVDGRKL